MRCRSQTNAKNRSTAAVSGPLSASEAPQLTKQRARAGVAAGAGGVDGVSLAESAEGAGGGADGVDVVGGADGGVSAGEDGGCGGSDGLPPGGPTFASQKQALEL
jgi:hypothetical protein